MPPDPIKSEIITPPQNEPQPDREAQLDGDLAAIFETSTPKPQEKVNEPTKQVEPKTTPDKPKEQPEPEKSNKDKLPEDKKDSDEDLNTKPSKEGWKVLRESAKQAKKTIVEKDAELAKLKTALAEKGQVTSQEAENLKKEIEELKSYRAMVDIQADPEFVSKFDEPISKRTEQIHKMLTEWGVAEEIIKKIDYTDAGLLDKISDSIAENKDKISAKKFLRHAEEINELYEKKSEHLEEYKKNYKTLLETKKKESFTKQAETEGRVQKHLQSIAEMKDEKGEIQFPFLSEITAKDPTNADELVQVERHNKVVGVLREKLENALKAESPEDKAEVAVAAVSAHWTSAQLRAAVKKIESLQAELAKISKVSSETPRSQKVRSNGSSNNGDQDLDLDSALSNFMSAGR